MKQSQNLKDFINSRGQQANSPQNSRPPLNVPPRPTKGAALKREQFYSNSPAYIQHSPDQRHRGSALSHARKKNFSAIAAPKRPKNSDHLGYSPLLGDPNAKMERSIKYGKHGKNKSLHSIPMLQYNLFQGHRKNKSGDLSLSDHNMSNGSTTSCDYKGQEMEEFTSEGTSPFELLQILKPLVISRNSEYDAIRRTASNSILANVVSSTNPQIQQELRDYPPPSQCSSRHAVSRNQSAIFFEGDVARHSLDPYRADSVHKQLILSLERKSFNEDQRYEGQLFDDDSPFLLKGLNDSDFKKNVLDSYTTQGDKITDETPKTDGGIRPLMPQKLIYEDKDKTSTFASLNSKGRAQIMSEERLQERRKSSISAAVEAARRNRDRESEEEEAQEEQKEAATIEDVVTQINQNVDLEEQNKEGLSVTLEEKLCRQHLIHTYHAVLYSKQLAPADPQAVKSKRVMLPPLSSKNKKTIVFDLDETLIHYDQQALNSAQRLKQVDAVLDVRFPSGEVAQAPINVRPYALQCLQQVSQNNEVIVFTASHQCYADVILDYLDPEHTMIHHRFYREHCLVTPEGVHVKNLEVLGNRELKNIVIIDNAVYSFGYHLDNGIPMVPFYDNRSDKELVLLMQYIESLEEAEDVRQHNRAAFSLQHFDEEKLREQLTDGRSKSPQKENEQNLSPNRPSKTLSDAATGDSGEKNGPESIAGTGEFYEEECGGREEELFKEEEKKRAGEI